METKPELLSCPFCGSQPSLSGEDLQFPYVRCSNNLCGVKISAYKNQTSAIVRWNTRAQGEKQP